MIDSEGPDVASSDLFFGLAAILIVTLCLLSSNLRDRLAADRTAESLATVGAGQGAPLAIADADGLRLVAGDGTIRQVGLADILSPETETWVRTAPQPVRVILTPSATDSAFLLETLLARAGVPVVERFRLAEPCAKPVFRSGRLTCNV